MNHKAQRYASEIAYWLDRKHEVEDLAFEGGFDHRTRESRSAYTEYVHAEEMWLNYYESLLTALDEAYLSRDVDLMRNACKAARDAQYAIAWEGHLASYCNIADDEVIIDYIPGDINKRLVSNNSFIVGKCRELREMRRDLEKRIAELEQEQVFAEIDTILAEINA